MISKHFSLSTHRNVIIFIYFAIIYKYYFDQICSLRQDKEESLYRFAKKRP